MDVLEALEIASKQCLPISGKLSPKWKNRSIPGWNEHVKPYATESRFWQSVWLSMGKPASGDIYENMKYSNSQYKYALRRLKRCNDRIKNDKFLAGVLTDGRNIFNEIRKLRGNPRIVPSRIDTTVGSQDISNHFSRIYSNLYNNVETDQN